MLELIVLLYSTALQYNVDPEVVYAIAKVESQLDHTKVGSKGEIGMFQLLPSSFPEYSVKELKDRKKNIEIAVKYLDKLQKSCKHKKDFSWVTCYNYGVNGGSKLKEPKKTTYYKKFMLEYKKNQKYVIRRKK